MEQTELPLADTDTSVPNQPFDYATHRAMAEQRRRTQVFFSPIGLCLALQVPLLMREWEAQGGPPAEAFQDLSAFTEVIGEKGDIFIHGRDELDKPKKKSKRPVVDEDVLFRQTMIDRLTRSVAVMAWFPGGVSTHGLHFDAGTPNADGHVCCHSYGAPPPDQWE